MFLSQNMSTSQNHKKSWNWSNFHCHVWPYQCCVCCYWNESIDSGLSCSTLTLTHHVANENQACQVKHDQPPCRSLVSATWNREWRCMLQDCQHFSCRRAYSFVIGYDVIFYQCLWLSTSHVCTLQPSLPSSEPVKIAEKGIEFSTNQHWNRSSGSDAWLGKHGFAFCFVFWLAVDSLDHWKFVCVSMMIKSLASVCVRAEICV